VNGSACRRPVVDFGDFIETVKAFESETMLLQQSRSNALVAAGEGNLRDFEVATLVAAAECSDSPITGTFMFKISVKMREAGYRDVAFTLGIASLVRLGLLEEGVIEDDEDGCTYPTAKLTPNGWQWLNENIERLVLRDEPFSF
jgi:hypothetical protein